MDEYLARKLRSLRNIIINKVCDAVRQHYTGADSPEMPDLYPLYIECMQMEFGDLINLGGIRTMLKALSTLLSIDIHKNPAEADEKIRTTLERQTDRETFEALFTEIVEYLSSDSD